LYDKFAINFDSLPTWNLLVRCLSAYLSQKSEKNYFMKVGLFYPFCCRSIKSVLWNILSPLGILDQLLWKVLITISTLYRNSPNFRAQELQEKKTAPSILLNKMPPKSLFDYLPNEISLYGI
jgi:hypothetical protein